MQRKIITFTSIILMALTAFAGCSSLNHIEFNGNVYDSVGNFMAAFNACRASQK